MRNETAIKKRTRGINWDTAVFLALFDVGAVEPGVVTLKDWIALSETRTKSFDD